ncbi:MAG: acetate--CoA ligase family protein [Phycisphaerales bacterium]|nr:acetate--CoA ligase family protein [Phycisphaerales bacterium]
MARLHEHQAKGILSRAGIATPRGRVATSPDEAAHAAEDLGRPVVVKIQAFTTGRKAMGGVAFADDPNQASAHAHRMLGMSVGAFPVREVLVEEQLPPQREFFVSLTIDDKARAPLLLLAASGGSGVEDRAREVARIPCSVHTGPDAAAMESFTKSASLTGDSKAKFLDTISKLFRAARDADARSLEVNPLAILADGRIVALDCRATIDDYAVFRHPEFGIEIARELDHPPTDLERTAYRVEQDDHRGTFFFAQMATQPAPGAKGLAGFHGAGGGGSMMCMDAIVNEGFTIANFTDTSGNPSAAKVYRAARIILTQPGLCGYFGSGSGVASQEQFWSAYGLAKAFWELDLDIPAVIRLGGNTEDRAVAILHAAREGLTAPIEGYRKTDTPAFIASRFAELVAQSHARPWHPRPPRRPAFVGVPHAAKFPIAGGTLWIDPTAWKTSAPAIVANSSGLLRDDHGKPSITVTPEDLAKKDSELIACEVECRILGIDGIFVELDIPGLGTSTAEDAEFR